MCRPLRSIDVIPRADAKDEWTGLDSIVAPGAEGENPYRFNSKRWKAQSETYDMGLRDYSPEHNRFISRDSYTSAAADMSLGSGPATSNHDTLAQISAGFGISVGTAHAYTIAVINLLAARAPGLLKVLREYEPE